LTPDRKQGGLPARTPAPSSVLLLVDCDSYVTPSWKEYTKIPTGTGGYPDFLMEKSPETTFLIKILIRYKFLKIHFARNRF
jgi:hypothetical protein